MPGEHLYTHNDGGTEVLLLDVDTGDQVGSFSAGNEVSSTLIDLDGNIYVGYDGNGEIAKFDENFEEQWRWSDGFSGVSKLFLWPDKNHVYVGEDGRYHAFDRDSGDHLYTSFAPNEEVMDFTRDQEYLYTCSYGDDDIHRVDPDTGDEEGEWGPQYDIGGILDYNGYFFIAFSGASAVRRYESWDSTNYVSYTDPNGSIYSNIVADGQGTLYVGTAGATVYAFDYESLETEWNNDFETAGAGWITSLSVTPNKQVFANDRDEESTCAFDTQTGDRVWERDDIGFFIWESFSAWPQYDIYKNDDWYGSIELSGSVTMHDDPVEGADVLIIDEAENEFANRVVTDTDGNWTADAPDSTLHVITQYEDEDGNQYNDVSYPYISE